MNKCQKYIAKLSNTSPNNPQFGVYLNKLNYWFEHKRG